MIESFGVPRASLKSEIVLMHVFYCRLTLCFLLLVGCQNVSELTADLEGKREATFWFWAKLQGIQYRGNPAIKQLAESNNVSAKSSDIDGTAEGFSKLSMQHADLARQLSGLDRENVDQIAIAYRGRLVESHEAISADYQRLAEATKNRERAKIVTDRETLYQHLREYVELWKERKTIMAKLSDTYGGDFNSQD